MRLATRLFAASSLLVALTVVGLVLAADRILRRELEAETARGLEREARLVVTEIPEDSLAWPGAAMHIGALIGHRVTLIDSTGRVRGDTEFPKDALSGLENHGHRPEVLEALAHGVGYYSRLSASTNERRMYVAIRGGPPPLVVVRLSTTLAAVDAQVNTVQGAIAVAGLLAILLAALFAWIGSRHLARPLVELTAAARAIAEERTPSFPDSSIHEVSRHILALRAMHEQLDRRFADLRRERTETAELVEAMADAVIAADAGGTIQTCNAAARRLLRLGPSETLPPLSELFHEKAAREIVRTVRDGHGVDEEPVHLGDRDLLVTGRSLEGGGTLLVLRDVSQLRRLESVRRDFVANVSHELKTPLTAIAGYAETLTAETDPASHSGKFSAAILAHARRMQRLVEDLLDLSRIESGGWHPVPAVLDVEHEVREAWAAQAGASADAVKLVVAPSADATSLAADAEAFRQILDNLLSNALRHTPAGGTIRVTTELSADGVVLTVSDTGSGIPSEHLSRIFERFYRVDPGRSREQGGTGLGLSIVKHLVEAHRGRVSAESTLGRGTSIRMVFPAVTKS